MTLPQAVGGSFCGTYFWGRAWIGSNFGALMGKSTDVRRCGDEKATLLGRQQNMSSKQLLPLFQYRNAALANVGSCTSNNRGPPTNNSPASEQQQSIGCQFVGQQISNLAIGGGKGKRLDDDVHSN